MSDKTSGMRTNGANPEHHYACREIVAERDALKLRVEELERALQKISDTISVFQTEADAQGDALNICVAMQLSRDPEFLKDIARKALNSTKEAK